MATNMVLIEWVGPQDKPMPRLRILRPEDIDPDSSPLLITTAADDPALDRLGQLIAEDPLVGEAGGDAAGYLATAERHDETVRSLFPADERGLDRLQNLLGALDPEGQAQVEPLLARFRGRLT